jgi:hypothetical protein
VIRRAELSDVPQIMALGREFLAYSPHRWMELNEADFEASVRGIIEGAGAIFLTEGGFIGGVLVPCWFNRATIWASELFWFAHKDGDALLKAFEGWAKEAGAAVVYTSGLADGHEKAIRRVYRRNGYEASEVAFQKRL